MAALGALTVAAVVLAVIVVGSPEAATTPGRTVAVKRGVVQSTVSGSGNLAAANQADLAFSTSGEVTHVYVKEGEHVSKGRLLATLDPSSAEVDLAQAKADLASAEAQLDSASSGSTTTTASDTSTTPVMLAVAAQATPTPTPTPTAEASPTPRPTVSATATPAPTATASATPAASGGSGATGGSSGSSGTGGSGSSSSSSGASSATSVAAAQASVDSAELTVTKARKALAATKLRAPMPGTIAAVSGAVGDSVSGGSSSPSSSSGSSSTPDASSSSAAAASSSSSGFITLAQLHRFKLEVSLSESDIGKVHKGQAATVTVNAVSGLELSGHVSSVGVLSSSSSSSDAVSYPVTIVMDQGTSKARSGMSATADVITDQASGLVVPSQAVRGSTVTVVRDGEHVQTRVTTGVTGDTSTQVLSGVSAGDELYVTSTSAAAGASATGSSSPSTSGQQQQGQRAFGGGGFAGGAPPAGGFGGGAPAGGRP